MSDAQDEVWKDIPDWPYQVSSLGRVRRVRYLQPQVCIGGYLRVEMNNGDQTCRKLIHRMVAAAFHGPCPPDKREAAHKDGNPQNNTPENIYWATAKENAADRVRHGNSPSGSENTNAKLTDEQVREIRRLYHEHGLGGPTLAKRYGTSNHSIYRVVNNKSYLSAGGYGL